VSTTITIMQPSSLRWNLGAVTEQTTQVAMMLDAVCPLNDGDGGGGDDDDDACCRGS